MDSFFKAFDEIYTTDLVYQSGCWQLCGDAHCCHFSRHKAKFRLIAQQPFQELPLLPFEYDFLASKNWLGQFGEHERKVMTYEVGGVTLMVESIVSFRPKCACDHGTRTTICRLYPQLPVFDIEGSLVATEPIGIYEELEWIGGEKPICQVSTVPFSELQKLLFICRELAANPLHLFYLEAYRIVKRHVRCRVALERGARKPFAQFERMWLRQRLVDHTLLRAELETLIGRFEIYYGDNFLRPLFAYCNSQLAES